MCRKKLIIVLSVMSMALVAAAQPSRFDAQVSSSQRPLTFMRPRVAVREMKMRAPGESITTPSIGLAKLRPFYRRPAGAFYCSMLAVNGVGGYSYNQDFALFKPFSDYTFYGMVGGEDENTHYSWTVYQSDALGDFIDDEKAIHVTYGISTQMMPCFYAVDGELDDPYAMWYSYQMPLISPAGNDNPDGTVIVSDWKPTEIWSIPAPRSISSENGVDFLLSSRTNFVVNNTNTTYVSYYGATPYGDNSDGWWFGKNGDHIDGMAQVFEKPEHPYLLKKVYMMVDDDAVVTAPVKLTCKVYKLDEVPAYNDTMTVGLPDEPGELILIGEGLVTPETCNDKNGFIEFTLYGFEEDDPELTYECNPTIDDPIMVVIDGYNDPEAEGLKDFKAFISNNYEFDEGYGETAYLKYPRYAVELDENGDTVKDEQGQPVQQFTGEYYWRGLNNFFRSGTMMTAFSIFIVADQPFVSFKYANEDGVYTFPVEGGEMSKAVDVDGQTEVMDGIYFYSWVPSVDDDWTLTWNGSDKLPDWLHIELEDLDGNDDNGWDVYAGVSADPLPESMDYREATIRFEIPGDYIDYKFMQGEKTDPYIVPEPIVFFNTIIDLILHGGYDVRYDVDHDGAINIADLNLAIFQLID